MHSSSPYGRHTVEVLGSVPADTHPPTYYGRPALKPAEWRWLITTYLFTGGLAGAAQVIAGIVDLLGHRRDRPLVSAARYVALAGALVSPLLLIADLKTPSRWYNMIRVFRPTSPMSIGSWTLLAFGSASGLAAAAQIVSDFFDVAWARRAARFIGVAAAISGGVMATYTGSLLSATSTPFWAVAYRWLPALFGVSGTATATALLSLLLERQPGTRRSRRRLEHLALVTSCVELGLTAGVDAQLRRARVRTPLDEPSLGVAYRFGAVGLGVLAPLVVHGLQVLTGRDLHALSRGVAVGALVGGYTQRAALVMAGKESASRPQDYFRVAR